MIIRKGIGLISNKGSTSNDKSYTLLWKMIQVNMNNKKNMQEKIDHEDPLQGIQKPTHPIKAVVMDMDGTLLDEHNRITPNTQAKLIELQEKGVQLILASGRSYTRLLPYADQLNMKEHHGYLLEIDGVALYDLALDQRTKYHMMSLAEIQEIFDYLTTKSAETQAMFDDGLFGYIAPELMEKKIALRKTMNVDEDFPWTAGPWSWLCDFRDGYPNIHYIKSAKEITLPINKLQIMQEEQPLALLFQDLQQKFGDQFSIYRTTPRQLEVLPKGFSKGSGVLALMEKEGWKKGEVVVFGDGENDCSMFEVVEYSFAMGNAKQYVQNKARYVTKSNRQEGVIYALQALGLLSN